MQRCPNNHYKKLDQFVNINNKPMKLCRDCREINHFYYLCVVKDQNIIKVENNKRTKKIKKLKSLNLFVTFD
jgi:hypothetical protein